MEAGGGGGGSSGSSNVAKVSQYDLKPYHATLYGRKRNLKYRGQMVGNMKEGWGSLVYNDGSQYIGNWQENKRNGYGTMTTFASNQMKSARRPKMRYTGEWKDDQREGFGTEETFDYERKLILVLEGCWKDDLFHGWGRKLELDLKKELKTSKFTNSSGDLKSNSQGILNTLKYEGSWLNGIRDGVGISLYENGDYFEGLWSNDQRNGAGRYWFAKTERFLEGFWKDDKFQSGFMTLDKSTKPESD